jgi:hypothetical protein
MEKKNSDDMVSNSSSFLSTPQNTSCTGGTVSYISITSSDDSSDNVKFILTYNELRSFPGLETISKDEAENVIKSLYQLSMITYQVFIHD